MYYLVVFRFLFRYVKNLIPLCKISIFCKGSVLYCFQNRRNCVPETCPCKETSFLNYVTNCIKGIYIVEIEQEIFNNTYPRVIIRL